MTINEVLERVSRLKPNAVEEQDVAHWILRLDEQLFKELHMPEMVPISTYPDLLPKDADGNPIYPQPSSGDHPATELLVPFRRPKKWPEDGDIDLVAPAPYDGFYELYAIARIEFVQREYNNYNNTVLLYHQAVMDFRRAYRREHQPEAKYIDTGGGASDYDSSGDPLYR